MKVSSINNVNNYNPTFKLNVQHSIKYNRPEDIKELVDIVHLKNGNKCEFIQTYQRDQLVKKTKIATDNVGNVIKAKVKEFAKKWSEVGVLDFLK